MKTLSLHGAWGAYERKRQEDERTIRELREEVGPEPCSRPLESATRVRCHTVCLTGRAAPAEVVPDDDATLWWCTLPTQLEVWKRQASEAQAELARVQDEGRGLRQAVIPQLQVRRPRLIVCPLFGVLPHGAGNNV